MDDATKKLVEEAERLAEKAQPAPWSAIGDLDIVADGKGFGVADFADIGNAEFVAFSREAVPALCKALRDEAEENERLRARVAELEAPLVWTTQS
jgi:predicted ATP-dependent protease